MLFIAALIVHFIEEAIWLPAWSKNAGRFIKPLEPSVFRFTALSITIIAILGTSQYMQYIDNPITRFVYFGFLGVMSVNAIVPHVLLTIIQKRYMPGLISGVLLILPINCTIIHGAVKYGVINVYELLISTIITGVLLLIAIPILNKLGKKITDYN